MRQSKLFAPTLRETPAEADIVSHQLMLRAGMIRKSAAGVYTYLPLAQRVLRKIMAIVREEMDREGGQELALPIIQPAEIWKESGRWEVYGPEMFRVEDRHHREFCLGPTHEEIVTTIVKGDVRSYRDLPLRLYQIQNKYRDEIRPRFGLMRGREFIMKDLYSFDIDEAGLEESYQAMYRAYTRVFTRCGLKFRPVEADSGAIGGNTSQEFMVLADNGEAMIVYCDECSYAANIEKATSKVKAEAAAGPAKVLEKTATPNQKTIEEVTTFLKIKPENTVKTLFYGIDHGYVAVLVRGDDQVNEIKLGNLVGGNKLYLATPSEINEVYGLPIGSVGPIGLDAKIKIYADNLVKELHQVVVGANQEGYHYINAEPLRDFPAEITYADLRTVKPGEGCPRCRGRLHDARGIEAGQIFKLGVKYSKALGATYLDEQGKSQLMIMGCYGIGVSRTMAAAIEQHFDENGIKWPVSIAPFQAHLVPVSADQLPVAEDLYSKLAEAGVEVLLDDRSERPGVKFKDADLIGIPVRITIGPKGLAQGEVEVKYRQTGAEERWPLTEVVARVKGYLVAAG